MSFWQELGRSILQRRKKKRSYSFTFHCPQCLNGFAETAFAMLQNGHRTSNKKERKTRASTKNEITYLFMDFICTEKCELLHLATGVHIWTFDIHLTPADCYEFCHHFLLLLTFLSLSSLNKRYKSNIYAFAPFLWACACACTFFPFRWRIFFMKWWYTFCLHVMALFMPFL